MTSERRDDATIKIWKSIRKYLDTTEHLQSQEIENFAFCFFFANKPAIYNV